MFNNDPFNNNPFGGGPFGNATFSGSSIGSAPTPFERQLTPFHMDPKTFQSLPYGVQRDIGRDWDLQQHFRRQADEINRNLGMAPPLKVGPFGRF